jgi:membrane fusion protein (multidrug efflux system)
MTDAVYEGGARSVSEPEPEPEREGERRKEEPRPNEKPRNVEALKRFVHKHRHALPVAFVLAIALAIGAVLLFRYLATFESTDDAQVDGDISAIATRIAGTVVAVHVENDEDVTVGAPLVELDPADYKLAVEQAVANLAQARQRLAQAQANANVSGQELARSRNLLESNATPRQSYDQLAATAAARQAEVGADRAAIDAAQAALDRAKLDLDYTRIQAPVAGIVGQKSVAVGDRVQPAQPMLAVVQVHHLWITANFKETQLRQMVPGQRADVHVDALDVTFHGHVESLPGASGARFSLLPPENATGNFVKVVQRLPVRIALDPDQPGLDRLRPGMSVEPKVWLK